MPTMRTFSTLPYASIPLLGTSTALTRDALESPNGYIDNGPLLLISCLCVIAAVILWDYPFPDQSSPARARWRKIARCCSLSLLCITALASQEIVYSNVEEVYGQLPVNLLRVFLVLICSALCAVISRLRNSKPLPNILMGILGPVGLILVISNGRRAPRGSSRTAEER